MQVDFPTHTNGNHVICLLISTGQKKQKHSYFQSSLSATQHFLAQGFPKPKEIPFVEKRCLMFTIPPQI